VSPGPLHAHLGELGADPVDGRHLFVGLFGKGRFKCILTGPSGLVVVDLDTAEHGDPMPPEWTERGAACGADVLAILAAQAWPSCCSAADTTSRSENYF
jgi:hypothetical protein